MTGRYVYRPRTAEDMKRHLDRYKKCQRRCERRGAVRRQTSAA